MSFVKNDYYAQAYKTYLKLSCQREANIRCLQKCIPKALQQLQLQQDLPQNRPRFNILSIGAGDGVDQEIVKIVKEGYLDAGKQFAEEFKILNTAVEPHPNMIKQYEASIERRSNVEGSVEFDLKPMSFEEYAQTKHDQMQYVIVHFMHSIYHVDSTESTLEHCYYNELGRKGLIACFLADRECIIYPIHDRVTKKGRDDESKKRPLNVDDIVAIAEKNKWKFERITCPYSIDVTGILKENSEEGRLLIDWLTFVPAFYQSADQEVIDVVLELLEKRSTEDDDGRSVVPAANELILIYKS